jgi:signal transduction histidine kinase
MTASPGAPVADRRGAPGRSRQTRLVVAAALAAGAALGVAGAAVALAGGGRAAVVVVASGAVAVPVLVLVGQAPVVRRHADGAFVGAVGALALVVVVLGAQLVVVLVAGRVPTGDERWWFLPSLAVAGLTALVFPLVRRGLTEPARSAVVGERRDPADVVRTFGDRASRGIPDGELLLQLAESLQRTLRLSQAEVWTGVGGWLERVVAVPDQPAATVRLDPEVRTALVNSGVVGEAWLRLWLPVLLADDGGTDGRELRVVAAHHSGEVLGLVVAERASTHDRFTTEEDVALGELGRRLGVVLHNRQLDATLEATLDDLRHANEELRASRSRLVAAADAERRRLERDLHDGAQQHLVALAVNIRVARDLVADDPASAASLLDELGEAVRTTINEVRDLAHGIYPPLLRDAGLVEALRAVARRQPQPVDLQAEDVGRYPADVEAAVYFCCLEALQNAAKHAPDADVTIRLHADAAAGSSVAAPTLRFEVRDDGPGFDPGTVHLGAGLRHLADRLGAVGGTVQWAAAPGAGTRVAGVVPIADGDGVR